MALRWVTTVLIIAGLAVLAAFWIDRPVPILVSLAVLIVVLFAFRSASGRFRHLRTHRSAVDASDEQFLAFRMLCHELRSPISTLTSLTRALADEGVRLSGPDRREALLMLRDQATHLDSLWRHAVAVAQGMVVRDEERLPLRQILSAAPRTTVPPERVCVRMSEAAGSWPTPARSFRQVLTNLLDNALRHGPDNGNVHLSASIRSGDLVLIVSDEGRSYEGLDAALCRATPSPGMSGLGLWLVRHLVTAQGGSIRAYGLRPRGVAVEVVLPGDGKSRTRIWPRWTTRWPRWARWAGMTPLSASRQRGGHDVQPRQGPTVRSQAGRP